jgi:iron(III) transport system ATP-binding protein
VATAERGGSRLGEEVATASAGVAVAGVSKSFDAGVPVLHGVDVSVEAGATLALLGPSGCGKTTLLRIIAGLEVPDAGTVTVGGRELTGPGGVVPPEKRRVGMVFQDWALFPHLSVARNVGFGLPRSDRRESPRIDEALELVGLGGLGERMPSTLSGGQQQRVALARAIAPRPSVLLLDEPFSNLDATLRTRVRTEIHQLLVGLGITTIFVTHDQDEAFILGDHVAVLSEGRVVQHGTPAELYLRPRTRWLADFVGDANFLPATAQGELADSAIGDLPLDHSGDGPVEVLVRPEHLDLHPVLPHGADRAGERGSAADEPGTVELVEYVGHDTTYLVRLGELTVRVRRPSQPVVERGEQVRLRYVGGATTWFPPQT